MESLVMEQPLLTTKQAATLVGVSVAWFEKRRWEGTDQPPYIRIGRTVRYDRGALMRWCRDRQVTPGQGV
jgi:predicted DNA-binding transcriptional regulator AlpA